MCIVVGIGSGFCSCDVVPLWASSVDIADVVVVDAGDLDGAGFSSRVGGIEGMDSSLDTSTEVSEDCVSISGCGTRESSD